MGRINAQSQQVQRIHLIFKTHLDLGFTDFAHKVVERYFEDFIPRAIALAKQVREEGAAERFVWTTGSWLIYEYLEQASSAARTRMEEAIASGDVIWHGLPFTTHTELMDASLFRYGLSLSQRLDARFGKKTIAAKMTDVPGHTRAIVPLLAEAGIQFLHLGVNPASTAPDVPDVFRWQHTDGNEVVVLYHKDDYGLTSVVEGMQSGLSFAHTRDNEGPQSRAEVRGIYQNLGTHFPDAVIEASSMDAFALELMTHKDQLPIVTGELGDTWIHGVAADPERVAAYRTLARLRKRWQEEGRFDEANPAHDRFSRTLLCVPEHTWGIMVDVLNNKERYAGKAFEALRRTEAAQRLEESWEEQRQYNQQALEALGDSSLAKEAKQALEGFSPSQSRHPAYQLLEAGTDIKTSHFHSRIDPSTGAIAFLKERATGQVWANASHPLGLFMFEMFSQADYDRFARQYITHLKETARWSLLAFTKQGMDPERRIAHTQWRPERGTTYLREDETGHNLLIEMSMPRLPHKQFGCPEKVTMALTMPHEKPDLHVDLQWFNKRACRLPAAAWIGFRPKVQKREGWRLHKMGTWISPFAVVPKGNRKLHAIESGVRYEGPEGQLQLASLDAALVAPGRPSLLDFNQRQPAVKHGMHFNLWNNVWNTNFPYWHEGDARFRFTLSFGNDDVAV